MELDVRVTTRGPRAPRLVGREEAWRVLDAALERAARFEAPQMVTVLGPLGMGKTRLVDEWLNAVGESTGARVVRSAASDRAEPLVVIATLLRRRFGMEGLLDHDAAMAAFRAELQSVFGDRRVSEVAGLLGRFLGFALPESPLGQALALRPDQEVDVARAVLCRFLEEDARARPLILAIDDAQLADDASLEVLAQLVRELGEASVVILVAARPELLVRRPDWGRGEGSHTRLELGPLSPLETDLVIRAALGAESLAPGLAERAAIESGGNPFLLEQLLRVYLQHGILVAETDTSFRFDLERAEALEVALGPEVAAQSRLAELSPAERELLTRGAAFGPFFWTGGVVALGRLGAEPWDPTTVFAPDPAIDEVRRLLALLAEREYLVRAERSRVAGETEWAFVRSEEHALLVAAVDPELMRSYKRFAAQWIEGRTGPSCERFELVGQLYEASGDGRRAGEALVAAADEARRLRAYERAHALYLRGLALLDRDDSVLKLDAYHRLGDAAARLGRTHEALAHFGEMLRTAWRMDLPAKGGAAHARIGRLHRSLGDLARALQHLDLARLLFELAGDRAGVAATLDDIGRVNFLMGRSEASIRCHRAALGEREVLKDRRGKALTLSFLGLVEMQAGRLGEAQRCFRQALEIGRASHDGHGVIFALVDLAAVEREAGRPARARPWLEEARRLAREMGERLSECHIDLQLGQCLLRDGDVEAAEREFEAAREIARKFGARRLLAEATRGIGEARLALGDTLAARDHAHTAATLAEGIGAAPLVGAALRILATAVARGAPGDLDRGGPREIFDRAVELLGSAGAELELARTLTAYAEFEERTGRSDVAFDLRAQAHGIDQRAREGVEVASATAATRGAGWEPSAVV